ncbi:hypothetical protein BC832DRAFT_533711 [Gaertneriomyces semiglobifer]|nr:hypothetical protein BC832DRAFT_533711 [Gaertneriomyces semiglobifer]
MAPAAKFILYATALLAACSGAVAQEISDFLEFDPPTLNIADVSFATEFKCRLKQAPQDKATVVWSTPGMKAGNCTTEFSPEDWNVYKPVTVYPINQYTKEGDVDMEIVAKCHAPGSVYDRHEKKYPVKRTYKKAKTCTSIGDPHYKTFGGTTFDYQTPGVHYLVKNEMLTIQSNTFKCSAKATCNAGIAIRYGEACVVINTDPKSKTQQMVLRQASPALPGMKVIEAANRKNYKLQLADGSEIQLNSLFWNNFAYINAEIRLGGPYFQKVNGLCNVYEDKTDTGLVCADGTITKKPPVFADSWKVPKDDNIFQCGNKCGNPTKPAPPHGEQCDGKLPDPPKPVEVTTSVVIIPTVPEYTAVDPAPPTSAPAPTSDATTPATPTAAPPAPPAEDDDDDCVLPGETPKPVPRPPTCPEEFYNQATKYCKDLFNVPGCETQVNIEFYVQSCIKDAIRTGSFIFADGGKNHMLTSCHAKLDAQKQSADPVEKEQAEQIEETAGLGDKPCLTGCGANGVCTPDGCHCNPGFSGLTCEVDEGTLLTYEAAPVVDTKGVSVDKKPNYQLPEGFPDLGASKPGIEPPAEVPSISGTLNMVASSFGMAAAAAAAMFAL